MKNSALRTLHFRPRTIRSISINAMRNPPRMTLLNLFYRNKIFLSVLFLFTLITAKHTNSSYGVDFHYEFETVFSPNADQYLIGQVNMMKVSESGFVTYWCPATPTGHGELLYRFDFPSISTDIHLKFRMSSYNFGSAYGSTKVLASNDGVSYQIIADSPTPNRIDNYVQFEQDLGGSLTGTDKFYMKVELDVVNWQIMSQFARSDVSWPQFQPIFSITQNMNGAINVPEPASWVLALTAMILLLGERCKRAFDKVVAFMRGSGSITISRHMLNLPSFSILRINRECNHIWLQNASVVMFCFVCPNCVNAVDFYYDFENVFSPNADQYLIGQVNMMKVSEGGQITYWCPTESTGQGELIYKFDFPVVSNDINLKFRLSDFNFGSSYGDASVFGSVDGVSYNLISHLSTPGPPWPYPSDDVFFNYPLGSEFLGQDKLFLKVQLNVVNSNIMAQFLRSDGHPQNYYRPWFSETPIFSITVNGAIVVPEPSGLNLLLIAILLYFTTSAKSSLIRRLNRF